MKKFGRTLLSLAVVMLWLSLGAWVASAQSALAYATLKNSTGQDVGSAVLSQQANGVKITINAKGLPPGKHGLHIHAVGKCDAPDFATAGGHFNPENKQHGTQNPQGSHAGDLPNLTIAADGSGAFDATHAKVTLSAGATSLFDADGSALVIHAGEDDEKTDPTGNSGGRIACGIIVAGTLPRTGAAQATTGFWLAGVSLSAALLALWGSRKLKMQHLA